MTSNFTQQELEIQVKTKAKVLQDGHYSVFCFTDGYRGFYGTFAEICDFRNYLLSTPYFLTIEDLYINMLANWQQHTVNEQLISRMTDRESDIIAHEIEVLQGDYDYIE